MPVFSDKSIIDGEEYISVQSFFADELCLSLGQGGKYAREGKFPAVKQFGKWFAKRQDLEAFIDSCRVPNKI